MLTLPEIKQYCRIDWDFDDELIMLIQDAASDYLMGQLETVEIPAPLLPQFKLCLLRVINYNYNNRDMMEATDRFGNGSRENQMLKLMLFEMKVRLDEYSQV